MDNIRLYIQGSFKGSFDEVARQMPDIEKHALYHAAFYMRDKIKQYLKNYLPKSDEHNPKYIDTLQDAVLFTKPDGASLVVHAMGNRKKGSGTYRTRFFEGGTKKRYQKSYNGKKLKKKRYLGQIAPLHFFSDAVQAERSNAVLKMEEILGQYIEKAFEKQQ